MGEKLDPRTGEIVGPVPDPYHESSRIAPLVPVEVHVGPLPAHPRDLQAALHNWESDRELVKKFLMESLRESEYNDRGYPINGRMHDYYKLPRTEDYRPTAVGAEKVALFFGLFKGPTEITVLNETKEYVSLKARVVLVDARGNIRGGGEKLISSAEKTFQETLTKKWGNDARAGLNDIASRGAKRAYVEAVSITCALGELFNEIARTRAERRPQVTSGAAPAAEKPASNGAKTVDPKPDSRGLPTVMPIGQHAGKPLTGFKTESLTKVAGWCRGQPEHDKLLEAINEILEARRET